MQFIHTMIEYTSAMMTVFNFCKKMHLGAIFKNMALVLKYIFKRVFYLPTYITES